MHCKGITPAVGQGIVCMQEMHKKGRIAFVSMCLQCIYDCFGPTANKKDKFYLNQNGNTYEILMTITGMER